MCNCLVTRALQKLSKENGYTITLSAIKPWNTCTIDKRIRDENESPDKHMTQFTFGIHIAPVMARYSSPPNFKN